jgi:archaemetzincin
MGAIALMPLPGAEAVDLEHIALQLELSLHREVTVAESLRHVDQAYDPSRDQYNSRTLIDLLRGLLPGDAERVLGVTNVDLFIPVLTFVFGEAQLGGPAGVVSFFRLDNRFYGLPENGELLLARLVKECVHEVGHTYGLLHCPDPDCVMRSSTYVEQIDLKQASFCIECGRTVQPDGPSSRMR